VNRLLVLALITASLTTWGGCGASFFVRGALNSQIITGTVHTAAVSVITSEGVVITVTLVTFIQSGNPATITFCGDQTSQFISGQLVAATFTPGQLCASVLQIVVTGP
jgi:hypothetical protein